MKITRIAHIGIAVADADQTGAFYSEKLDLPIKAKESLGELKIAFIPVGRSNLETGAIHPDGRRHVSTNEDFFPRSRKVKILTAGIFYIFRGLKFPPD